MSADPGPTKEPQEKAKKKPGKKPRRHRARRIMHRLVDRGNTVVVIEHNLEVVKTADWILDLGPEGGHGGGQIVAEGTPEEVASNPVSHTGRFLAELLGLAPVG